MLICERNPHTGLWLSKTWEAGAIRWGWGAERSNLLDHSRKLLYSVAFSKHPKKRWRARVCVCVCVWNGAGQLQSATGA